MSDLHQQETEFALLLQQAPFDDAPRAEHRVNLREQALARFDAADKSHAAPVWKRIWNQGRVLMKRPMPRLIALSAACLTIAAVWLLVPGGQSTAQAFNEFAEKLVAAKTARFQMEVAVEGQPQQKSRSFYRAPGKFRNEFERQGAVNITDFPAGKMVMLTPANKRAVVMNFKGEAKGQKFQSQFERLRELLSKTGDSKENQYESLGEKEIGGRPTVGFRCDSPSATATLWGDPATGYPVRIETIWTGIPRTEVTMTDFEIDVELKDSLFEVTPPPDYKVQSLDVDVSKPSEQRLVDALRAASDLNEAVFPDSLDSTGISMLVIKYSLSKATDGKQPSDEDANRLMKESINMGVGLQFALELPPSADAHYAGKGVKRETQDRPIFWYKLEGTNRYRVIFADLSVHDADKAPQVPGAQRIEKASKAARPAPK
jgi:outer membrane lipoprotein-sorting protein